MHESHSFSVCLQQFQALRTNDLLQSTHYHNTETPFSSMWEKKKKNTEYRIRLKSTRFNTNRNKKEEEEKERKRKHKQTNNSKIHITIFASLDVRNNEIFLPVGKIESCLNFLLNCDLYRIKRKCNFAGRRRIASETFKSDKRWGGRREHILVLTPTTCESVCAYARIQ